MSNIFEQTSVCFSHLPAAMFAPGRRFGFLKLRISKAGKSCKRKRRAPKHDSDPSNQFFKFSTQSKWKNTWWEIDGYLCIIQWRGAGKYKPRRWGREVGGWGVGRGEVLRDDSKPPPPPRHTCDVQEWKFIFSGLFPGHFLHRLLNRKLDSWSS